MANYNTPYNNERDGQIEFFDNYRVPYEDDDSILIDNTDGVYNGNLLEFKLNINNLNKVLFQAIKYLSKMRIKGESVPATILLIDLNATTLYVYKTQDYFDDIHKVYVGAASKNNEGFTAGPYLVKYDYSDMVQSAEAKRILKGRKDLNEMYMPIDIDENCIVGWATRYYREVKKASKGDFLGDDNGTAIKLKGEIREPKHFKDLINPYTGKTNEKFKYLMDCLNDRLRKKDLGAFYTPMPYCRKAAELVQMAVDRVPEGNDYIILDRCAGTGNLEAALIGLTDRNGDDLIEHCIVSTYEYYEYKVLQERIGDLVRHIIPPTEADVEYANGVVSNADAMSEEYINNPIIKQYVDDPKCTIILFENPPYSDDSGSARETGKTRGVTKTTWASQQFNINLKQSVKGMVRSKELANLFIWSGFKYYLSAPTDSFIIFSPIKYWKVGELANKRFEKGYLFNRAHFHATPSAISCILWSNIEDDQESITLSVYDICQQKTEYLTDTLCKKAHKTLNEFLDKSIHQGDELTGIFCGLDGYEGEKKSYTVAKPYYNEDIIASLRCAGFWFDAINVGIARTTLNVKPGGSYIRKKNYLQYLPLWVAKMYPIDSWHERDIYATTSDGGNAYTKDKDFLKACLIYTCFSNQNKCLSFDGSDGRRYQNELCFDDNSLASQDLSAMKLNDDEKELMVLWKKILDEAKQTANYNPEFNYGVYQITKELNTSHKDSQDKTIYDYPELNGDLDTLRTLLKAYYKSHITEKMFEYELLK